MNRSIRLFEIVVAASLMVCLGGILLGTFEKTREYKRGVTCTGNLKQMSLSVIQYIRDYDEVYPPTTKWSTVLNPYSKFDLASVKCPSAANGGYAMNKYLFQLNVSRVRDYAATPLFFETHVLGKSVSGAHDISLHHPRHRQGIALSYTDGHAAFVAEIKKTAYWSFIDFPPPPKKNHVRKPAKPHPPSNVKE